MGLEETDPEFIAHVGENDGPENDDPEADDVEDEAKGKSHTDDMKSPPKERKKSGQLLHLSTILRTNEEGFTEAQMSTKEMKSQRVQ